MVALRWTGNGLSNGTVITTGNVATAGNGDTMTFSSSGAGGGVMTTAGDGVNYYGSTADIRRLNSASFTATRTLVFQFFYTPGQSPTSGIERPLIFRSAAADAGAINHNTNGTVQLGLATLVSAGTATPALTVGDRYQVDGIIMINPGTPSSTNGRLVLRFRDLTNATWNTTGEFFYDTGYAINLGTADLTLVRYGKTSTGAIASGTPMLLEQLGWDPIGTDLTAVTTQAGLEAFFIPSPYAGTSYTPSPNDPVGITDSAAAVQARVVSIADPVGIADTGATQTVDFVSTFNDSEAITDSTGLLATGARGPADPTGITDTAASVADMVRSAGDPVGMTDAAGSNLDALRGPADPVGVTDSATRVVDAQRAPGDPVGVTDSVTAVMARVVTVDDFLALTDSATPSLDGVGESSVTDPVGISDLIATAADRPLSPADAVGAADTALAVLDRVATAVDPVGLTDSVVATLARVVVIADGVAVTDEAEAQHVNGLLVTPEERVYRILAEQRTYLIAAESRRLEVPSS